MIWFLLPIFWGTALLVVYPYLVYPLAMYLLPKRKKPTAAAAAFEPTVTLIISAYNEANVIQSKLENALALHYPADKLQILVVSDASTDDTDVVVREMAVKEPRIQLLQQPKRRGKSAGLNAAVEQASGEIVVFSDANAIYDAHAVRRLVNHFSSEKTGYVVGAALYHDGKGNRAAESEGLYWKLEIFLKQMESDFDSVVGGDGAIYAMRRELHTPLKDDDISDFVTPLQIVAQGYRGIFSPDAHCYEHAGESFANEFGRKRRIVNRSWRAYRRYGQLLNHLRHGRFLFMLLSHKVVRWFTFPLITIAWISNFFLLTYHPAYIATWTAITASLILAIVGAVMDRFGKKQPTITSFFYYFYLVNLAAALGVWDDWRGVRHVTWDHIRKQQP